MSGVPWYPVNLVLEGAPVLVVGGGPVGARKVDGLRAAGANVTLVSPTVTAALALRDDVRWHRRTYRRGEVASYRLAISATGVREVDEQIYRDAVAAGVPVNIADVPELCTFTLPAIARRGQVQVAVSTQGRSPALASWVRDQVAQALPDAIAEALDAVAEVRAELKAAGRSTEIAGWHEAFDDGFVDLVASGHIEQAKTLLRQKLGTGHQIGSAA